MTYHWLELSLLMRESRANIGHLFIIRIRDSTILVSLLWTHGSLTHTEIEYNTVILTIWEIAGNHQVISDIPSSSLLSQTMTSIFTICGSRFFKILEKTVNLIVRKIYFSLIYTSVNSLRKNFSSSTFLFFSRILILTYNFSYELFYSLSFLWSPRYLR